MPTLFVLRHAKSSWDDALLQDRERPLSPRGRRAVKVLAHHVAEAGTAPEEILCSPAVRTRETLAGVLPDRPASFEEPLYNADCAKLIARLRELTPGLRSAMVVGHNPAMQTLVLRLAGAQGDGHALEEIERKFPTGALATLAFDGAWSDLAPGRAQLLAYVKPKALV